MSSVTLTNVKASQLPEAWRKRAKVTGDQLVTATIALPARKLAKKKPNAIFRMWSDRTDLDPAAYVRALRAPRRASRRFTSLPRRKCVRPHSPPAAGGS
ncbi:MAG: hypothetical protein IT522_06540 [Burkholderiales bacterium]|nr:hypothetical protein [Burkholderiales bacterium]